MSVIRKPWSDVEAKKAIFLEIMGNIVQNPKLGEEYYESDAKAKQAFIDAGLDIPERIKIVFVDPRDSDIVGGGSAVIELPEPGTTPNDDEKLEFFRCTYNVW